MREPWEQATADKARRSRCPPAQTRAGRSGDDSEWSETEGAMSWRDEVDAVMAQANAAASEQEQAAADKRDQISHNHEQATEDKARRSR